MGELADYIDTQVKEVQTKKDFESLKNKVQGLKVTQLWLAWNDTSHDRMWSHLTAA